MRGPAVVVCYCWSGSSAEPICGGVLRTSSAACASEGGVGMPVAGRLGSTPMLDSDICASGCSAAGGSCDSNQLLVSSDWAVAEPLPFAPPSPLPTSSHDRPSPSAPPSRDRPSSALLNSLGTIHILLASPWAILGSVCRYW